MKLADSHSQTSAAEPGIRNSNPTSNSELETRNLLNETAESDRSDYWRRARHGRAIALAFAGEGAQVAVAARTLEQVEQVAREITISFQQGRWRSFVMFRPLPASKSFSRRSETFGRGPDILVNNAGIAESSLIVKTDDERWNRHLAVNLSGTFYCTRAALPSMIQLGGAGL